MADSSSLIGQTISHYRVVERLGGDGDYFYDTAGRYIGIMNNVTGGFHSAEVYAGAMHLGTYTSQFNFSHGDQLGTIHAWSTAGGALERTCTGLPGACPERSRRSDDENCSGTFASTLYYTGKEDDYAYNLDYFGARYYASSMGRPDAFTNTGRSVLSEPDRFMSPDPLGGWTGNPQSLNRYTYVLNNPETLVDPLGLCPQGQVQIPGGQCVPSQSIIHVDGIIYTEDYKDFFRFLLEAFLGWDSPIPPPTHAVSPDDILYIFDQRLPAFKYRLGTLKLQAMDIASNLLQNELQAWKNGYFACVASGGDTNSNTRAAGAQLLEKGAEQGLDQAAPFAAGAWYHFTDARFTAWGSSSKVLVPQAATITGVVDLAGGAWTDFDLGTGLLTCKPF